MFLKVGRTGYFFKMRIFKFLAVILYCFAPGTWSQEGDCSSDICILPDCFCPGRQGPLQLQTRDIPQMVMLTFDDALNEENYPFYTRLFRSGRNNPNGCPIAATFFVSHDWTNYDYVKELYINGHEIASHSITHKMPQSWWSKASYAELKEELEGQRRNIVHHAKIPKSQVRGIRVPFLETGGDTQFALMKNEGFEYDSSFIAGPYFEGDWRLPVWPYTLEFPPGLEFCDNHNCPKGNFSGIWEFPLNRWIGLDGKACPMVDACTTHTINTKQQALDYLWKNFKRFSGNNKAPFGVNMHATWFNDEYKLDAMDEFISNLNKQDDVYIVTVHQVVQWMKNPTSLREIKEFSPWKTTCGKRRRLVMTRMHSPKPRLQETDDSREIYTDAKLRQTPSRTSERLQSDSYEKHQPNAMNNRSTGLHNMEKTVDEQIKDGRDEANVAFEVVDYKKENYEKIEVNAVDGSDRNSPSEQGEKEARIPRPGKKGIVSANLARGNKQIVNSGQEVSPAMFIKMQIKFVVAALAVSIWWC